MRIKFEFIIIVYILKSKILIHPSNNESNLLNVAIHFSMERKFSSKFVDDAKTGRKEGRTLIVDKIARNIFDEESQDFCQERYRDLSKLKGGFFFFVANLSRFPCRLESWSIRFSAGGISPNFIYSIHLYKIYSGI